MDGLWQYLPEYEPNNPMLFVGIAPMNVRLDAKWERVHNPLPKHEESPFFDASRRAFSDDRLFLPALELSVGDRSWPKTVEVPPALAEGVFLVLTQCQFEGGNPVTDPQAFLCQVVVGGDFQKSCNADWSIWSPRPISWVQVSFARTPAGTRMMIHAGEDGMGAQVMCELKLEDCGINPEAPYRPVIFYGTVAYTRVEDVFDRSHF
ncbi:mao [Symbiodinium pilosum]|uniref:Mao protein n=1 Tax=Symbiodinium pilosum TaxID=2952 RepID=A0A812UQ01_SYMPI|nr:mao [Symbiodinium pilosum]